MGYNQYMGGTNWKKTTEPVIGFKKSYIRMGFTPDGKENVLLRPIQGHVNRPTMLNDVSQCPSGSSHQGKPSRFCTCGFHAYTDINDALNHTKIKAPIIKTVMSGKMIMYARGVRAANQRVSEVFVTECFQDICINQADRLITSSEGSFLIEVCSRHADKYLKSSARSFKWLEDTMNASLYNGEPNIKVKPLNPSTIPWDGTYFTPKTAETEKAASNPLTKVAVGAGLAFLGSMVVRDIVKTFSS